MGNAADRLLCRDVTDVCATGDLFADEPDGFFNRRGPGRGRGRGPLLCAAGEEEVEEEEEVPGPPFAEMPPEPVGELDPPLEDVLGAEPLPQELEQYGQSVGRRHAVSAPPFDMNEALSYVPLALGKRENEFSIIYRVFTEHPLFSTLEPGILRVLINAMEREEVLPGGIVCQPRRINEAFFIVCRGSVSLSRNPHFDATAQQQSGLSRVDGSRVDGSRVAGWLQSAKAWEAKQSALHHDSSLTSHDEPSVALFSTNLLYPSLPSHVVRAGENGATAYRLSMECFKNIVAKMNQLVDRRQVTLLGATILSENPSTRSRESDDSDSGNSASFQEELLTMPSEEFVVSHPTEANEPLSLFPISAAGLAAPFQPGNDTVWEQTQTALLTYIFPIERRVKWKESCAPHGDELSDTETRHAILGARRRWRRHAVVAERVCISDQFRPTPFYKTNDRYEALLRTVKRLPILSLLSAQRQKHVADCFERRVVPAGTAASHEFYYIESGTMLRETVFHQGRITPRKTFVIPGYGDPTTMSDSNSKRVSISSESGSCGTAMVRRLGPGECFGHEWLLYMHNERVSSDPPLYAASDEDAVLWTINRTTLRRIFVADALRILWKRLCLIRRTPAFALLNDMQSLRVANALVPVKISPGTALLRAGMDPADILLIERGTVEATADMEDGANSVAVHAHFIGHAQCVGAAEVFGGGESPFNYKTRSDVTAYRLSRFVFPRTFTVPVHARIAGVGGRVERQLQEAQMETIFQEQLEARDADSDAGSECAFTDDMCPVEVKNSEETAFLHEFLSGRPEYAAAPSMHRGLAVAAFGARRMLPRGTRLFTESIASKSDDDDDEADDDRNHNHNNNNNHNNSSDPCDPCGELFSGCGDFLFVISAGAVELTSAGAPVARFGRGLSVGEERLMRRRGAPSALAATVATAACAVHCLDRKSFRRLLMPAFLAHHRARRALLAAAPFSPRFGRDALAALGRRATEVWLEPAAVLLAHGSVPRGAFAVIDGTVNVARRQGAEPCATLSLGDIVGGVDIMRRKASVARYAARTWVRALFIPEDVFVDSFLRFEDTLAYMHELLQTKRYAIFDEELMDAREAEEDIPHDFISMETADAPWGAAYCIAHS